MEIWVDARISGYSLQEGVDRVIGTDLTIENGKLYDKGRLIGSYMTIENENDQQKAMGMAGIVEWLLVDFDNWAMIPIENLISAFNNTGTKVSCNYPLNSRGTRCWFCFGTRRRRPCHNT